MRLAAHGCARRRGRGGRYDPRVLAMIQTDLKMLALLPLVAGLFCAAWVDLRRRRIPNWLTAAILVAGFTQSLLPVHFASPGAAVAGFGAGFGVGLVMFVLRAFGGGDVKLLAALG